MWRHTLVILSNVECARNGWSDVQTPPTTTPKLQLDFLDLENFLVKVWGGGGGGGCLAPDPPPPTTTSPKLQLDFLDLKNFLVKVWGGGGGGGCLVPDPPPPPPLNSTCFTYKYYI